VVGAGVNGCFVSYYLSRKGHEVLLIDRDEGINTSVNNAGLLTPELAPSPPVSLSKLLKASIMPAGPLYFSPAQILKNAGWVASALSGIDDDKKEALVSFGKYSLQEFEDFFEREGGREKVSYRKGIVALFREKGLGDIQEQDIEELGYQGFSSGSFLQEEVSVNSHKLMDFIMKILDSYSNVSRIKGEVIGFVKDGKRVGALVTDKGEVKADNFLLTAGAYTTHLCKPLGYNPRILPARGMVLMFKTDEAEIVKSPAMFEDYGTAVAQHDSSLLRATSFFELKGFDKTFDEKRKRWLLSVLKKHIRDFDRLRLIYEGTGFRPCTPDQLPLIGRIPSFDNVFIAAGHCRVGMTLAPATGMLISDMLEGKNTNEKWKRAFDPSRFS